MYLANSSQGASGSGERRRNPRLRASTIIYVEFGSDNGGIVVNLGMDGVACQAAIEVTAKRNSTLNLRLRGSGLNVHLIGKLVWLGATRKEVGVCFQSVSAQVQQDIANWIERQTQGCETAALENGSQSKPMSAMSGMFATAEKLVPHSLSAALALSRAMFVDPPASADADANESFLPASLNSATGISDNTLLPEVVPPIQLCSNVAYDDLDGRPQGRNADSLASPEQCQVDQLLPSQSLIELSSTKHSYQSPANNSIPIVPSEAVTPEVREELPQASAERPGKSEFSKTEKIEPIPRDQVSPSSGSLVEATAVERWIPPALLALWKRGNRRQKLLLASAAVGCLWILVLILTLDVVHIDSSSGRSVGSGSVQRSTTPPAYSIASVGSAQTGPFQPPRASHAIVRPRSGPPPASPLAHFAETVLGYKPDVDDEPVAMTVIGEDQVGVPVWTSKSDGYYYCSDNQHYKTVRPGTLVTQLEALQSGYQPKLGQFCN